MTELSDTEKVQRYEQDTELARYSRQMLFDPIGEEGQRKLLQARVALIGCGGLGTMLASLLVRAGVGYLRIIDRDFIELSNLQRQALFDEDDLAANLPKAEAARRKLQRINTSVQVEAVVKEVHHRNIEGLCVEADLLLDGTDNFDTRFLINDLAVKTRRPWVYGAAVAATGLSMPIIPYETPCLRCLLEQIPPRSMNPTCNTAGVLAPVVSLVASHQAIEVLKILTGRFQAVDRRLWRMDAWNNCVSQIEVRKTYDEGDCICCKQQRFEYLEGQAGASSLELGERNAVHLPPTEELTIDFPVIAERLRIEGCEVVFNPFLLRARIEPHELVLFPDGRAVVNGTGQRAEAEALYTRYIGPVDV
ncbi:MAG: thiazole biosynthesis adenylyltransferase ThiF [Phycisphaerales bacterium]|nr:thiazole biosynthesis adenylyltransferase ThiF [Phycisphaerales bacterium]